MRILLIDSTCKYGSTGEICYNIYHYIKNTTGNSAAVFFGRGENIEEPNIYKFGLDFETKIHAGLARVTGYNGCFSPISTKRLIRKIEEYKPDIIHLHELHAYFVNIVPLIEYIKEHSIPVVWTFHCEYMYTGKCGYAGTCKKWMKECGNCPLIREYPKSFLLDQTKKMFKTKERLLSNLNAVYITPSDFYANRVKESFLKDKPVEVVHNGINTEIFFPRGKDKIRSEIGISHNKTIILSVAPKILSKRKGGNWILELAKRQKDKNVEYVLVGDGEKIEKLAENVTSVPLVRDKDKLAKIYSEADCFVLCSEHETFSMTCAEALCCGIPVAGFKCDAPETIFKNPWAEFVEYGDIDKLEKSILHQMKNDGKRIAEYGQNEFSNRNMSDNYFHVYERVLAGEYN